MLNPVHEPDSTVLDQAMRELPETLESGKKQGKKPPEPAPCVPDSVVDPCPTTIDEAMEESPETQEPGRIQGGTLSEPAPRPSQTRTMPQPLWTSSPTFENLRWTAPAQRQDKTRVETDAPEKNQSRTTRTRTSSSGPE